MIERAIYIVRQAGVIWGVYTTEPEEPFTLFEEATGYPENEFYVESLPLSDFPTIENIGMTYT